MASLTQGRTARARRRPRPHAGRAALVLLLAFALAAVALSRAALVSASQEGPGGAAAFKPESAKPQFVPGEVLVRFRGARATEAGEAVSSLSVEGGRTIPVEVERFGGSELVEGLRLVRVPADETLEAVAALAARPDVVYAAPNYLRRKSATTPNDPSFAELYALRNTGQLGGLADADIDADEAWDTTTGSDAVVVGVVDEGVDTSHPDLAPNVWTNPGEVPGNGVDDDGNGYADDTNGWDFAHGDRTVYDGAPGDGLTDAHGTHVAGTVGARGDNGTGVVGVNWRVKIMSLKVLGPDSGSDSDIISAYRYAKMMRDLHASSGGARGANLRVLNNSYGGPGYQPAAEDAIRELNAAGILFVASAGNDGRDNFGLPHYPAGYDLPNVISVAATTRVDTLSDFSNFGPRAVTMAAPGTLIYSTTPNNSYSYLSGTSMATPHVSGAAALVLAASPSLGVSRLRGALVYGGDPVQALASTTRTGRRLNARGAIQSALENDTTPPAAAQNLRVVSQQGRAVTLAWDAPGDDGMTGAASDYDLFFVNAATGARFLLPTSLRPSPAGTAEGATVALPLRNFSGQLELRAYDNAGNVSAASAPVSVGDSAATNPYEVTQGAAEPLSTGGTALGARGDDRLVTHALPFDFTYFGAPRRVVNVSTNGLLYFSPPPVGPGGTSDDAASSVAGLQGQAVIAPLWDDLRTDRAGGDVFVVQPDQNTVIFRWQAVTFNTPLSSGAGRGEQPVNFEVELRRDGTVKMRYGAGQSAPTNTRLFPVVGIGSGEPEAYVVASHTSESALKNLTNAPAVTFAPREAVPLRYTIQGRITNNVCCAGATDVGGITVALGGAQAATTTTDAGGFYRFTGLAPGGSYTVTPQKVGVVFTPPSRAFDNLSRDEAAADFAAERKTFRIEGRAVAAGGAPVVGATVVLAKTVPDSPIGIPSFTQTNAAGQFSFPGLDPGATYNVSISSPGHVFSGPTSVRFENLSADQTLTFEARLPRISGRVIDADGAGIAGADVALTGPQSRTTTTDAGGNFLFADVQGGEYTLTATKSTGGPYLHSARLASVWGDASVELPLLAYVNVSGRVVDPQGNAVRDVVIRIAGKPDLNMTSTAGTFNLVLTPTDARPVTVNFYKYGYRFDPPSLVVTRQGGSQTGLSVTARLANPIDDAEFFVRQHYLDFLGREPDPEGLAFWRGQIAGCVDSEGCTEFQRINTSGAFFLSIEFQETGYLVYRAYRAAYGHLPGRPVAVTRAEFLPDTRGIGEGVVVNSPGWEEKLEANKVAYFQRFVASARFLAKYPAGVTADQFVAALYATAGVAPEAADFEAARADFASVSEAQARARALRRLAQGQAISRRETNRAFVLMQYFGYLQRDPDSGQDTDFSGFDFWLCKLNGHGGDYIAAEMVKAFITSGEYRRRFGQE